MSLSPYLTFGGTCRDAMNFYAACLGVEMDMISTFAGTPAETHVPPEWRDKIMHASLQYRGATLMASDGMGPGDVKHEGFSVSVQATSIDDAERLFAALGAGGTVTIPLEETFWASRFGVLTDQFGVSWMINLDLPM
jgi:PhnB protein